MRFIVLVLVLVLTNIEVGAVTRVKQYIKEANAPLVNNHEDAKALASMQNQLEDLSKLDLFATNNPKTKLARKGGGKTASEAIIGTYRLNDDSLPESRILDIVAASIKDGNGLVEFVISNSDGFIFEHSIGILLNNKLSFQDVALNGSEYYVIALDPKKNFSGKGAGIYDVLSGNCFDYNEDGLLDINEYYACQFFGSDPQFATVSLDRLR